AASDGAGTVKINGALVDGTGVSGFRWAPDGSRIAYALFSEPELYTVRPDGNDHVKVSGPLGADDAITLFKWSPDGAWLPIGSVRCRPTTASSTSCVRTAPASSKSKASCRESPFRQARARAGSRVSTSSGRQTTSTSCSLQSATRGTSSSSIRCSPTLP